MGRSPVPFGESSGSSRGGPTIGPTEGSQAARVTKSTRRTLPNNQDCHSVDSQIIITQSEICVNNRFT